MREMTMTMTMTTKVSHRFASSTSRRGGRRATTVRAAGTVRRSEISLHPPRRGVARALRSSRRSRERVRAHR